MSVAIYDHGPLRKRMSFLLLSSLTSFPNGPPTPLPARCPPPQTSYGGAVLTEAGFDLLSQLLAWDPDGRISAEDALKHRWGGVTH